MSLLGDLLPHSPQTDVAAFWVVAALTLLPGVVCLRWPTRLPAWAYRALMTYATVVIAVAIYFDGERHGGPPVLDEVLYTWIALYAGYFFTRRQIVFQMAAISLSYAVALVEIHAGPTGVTRWIIVVMMASFVAAVVHLLKGESDRLVAELDHAARTDLITGLLNRRGFDQRFDHELERAERASSPMTLLLCDLDRLKLLNDTFGHPAGDSALAALATTLLRGVRSIDTVARIGGDEFAVLLPETSLARGRGLAERLSEAISGRRDPANETMSASFGVAAFPQDGATGKELLAKADASLYLAKSYSASRISSSAAAGSTVASKPAAARM
jgi:diguanylate cyclase (GGDEF)-like protein